MRIILLLAFAFIAVTTYYFTTLDNNQLSDSVISGKAIVYDGDTIRVGNHRILLYAIDAPELEQKCVNANQQFYCGQQAKKFLQDLIANNIIHCHIVGVDRYQRFLGLCEDNQNNSINATMVMHGFAFAYQYYTWRYVPHEFLAKWQQKGLFADNIIIERPSHWRQRHRRQQQNIRRKEN